MYCSRLTKNHRYILCLSLVLFCMLLFSCRPVKTIQAPTPTITPAGVAEKATESTPASPTPLPSPTALTRQKIILWASQGDTSLAAHLHTELAPLLNEAGLDWEEHPSLTAEDLSSNVRAVLVLPPNPGVAALAKAEQQVQFLAIGIPGLSPTSNLSLVNMSEAGMSEQAFMAGVIAAMVTSDWRVAVVSRMDTAEGKIAGQAFTNGVLYFCGLCRPVATYRDPQGGFIRYPMAVDLSAFTAGQQQDIARFLVDRYIQTVYVAPGAEDQALFEAISQAGIQILGAGAPPEGVRKSWITSLGFDPAATIKEAWPDLLNNKGGATWNMPLMLSEINNENFSPGKQQAARRVMQDLQDGYIDIGIAP